MNYFFVLFFSLVLGCACYAQEYFVTTVAFYNLENLFDCEDDPKIFDEEYLPNGEKNWTENLLDDKLTRMAKTMVKIGAGITKKPPVLIGVAEVENRWVLEQLINTSAFAPFDYGIVHEDSPDKRGIDVGLLYDRNIFRVQSKQNHFLKLFNEDLKPIYTRDQLCVSGFLAGELIHVIVNHWPSRRGGLKKSEPRRMAAAKLSLKIIDSLKLKYVSPKIILMGDFNDNPTNKSFKVTLNSVGEMKNDDNFYMYNPMEKMFKSGVGSLAYRDRWSLFDQILVSNSLLDSTSWYFKKAEVYSASFLKTKKGKYKGYPKRTFNSGVYNAGYSDHFPVYIYLLKKVSK